MRAFRVGAVMAMMMAVASEAGAQVCMGLPDNTVAPMNLSAGASFPQGAKIVGGRFGAGSASSFGGANVGYVSFDDADLSAVSFGVDGGLVIPMGQSTAKLCPVVSGSYRSGPKESGVSLNGMGATAELRIGGTLPVNSGFSVLPFVGGGVMYLREKVSGFGDSETFSDTGGVLSGGFGLQFNKIFVISPTVSIPVGFETSDATFGVSASIGFGKR